MAPVQDPDPVRFRLYKMALSKGSDLASLIGIKCRDYPLWKLASIGSIMKQLAASGTDGCSV